VLNALFGTTIKQKHILLSSAASLPIRESKKTTRSVAKFRMSRRGRTRKKEEGKTLVQ